MARKDGIVFRTAINGFHKDDVNRYILQLNREFEMERQELRDEIGTLKADLKKAEKASSAEKEISTQSKTDTAKEKELAADMETLKSQLESALAEKAELAEKVALLQKQIDQVNPTEEKAKLYDEISSQVGDVLIQAKKSASELLANAQKEADDYKQNTSNFIHEKINTFNGRMRTMSEQYLTDIKKQFEEIIENSASLLNDIAGENQLPCEDSENSSAETLGELLREMNTEANENEA